MIRTEKDKQCLVYETAALTQDLEVTGHPVADLWLTSNQKDGDVFVYLADVDENGQSLHVTESGLRAGWKALYPADDQVNGAIDVRPDLPWHGYKKAQWGDGQFDPAKPLNMRFDLYPTSWVFQRGHRIRISIAGADYPNFEINPILSPGGKPEDCPDTRLKIYRTKNFSSRIELPIIPKK
jgi:putative CocE/NonD family hydrolase